MSDLRREVGRLLGNHERRTEYSTRHFPRNPHRRYRPGSLELLLSTALARPGLRILTAEDPEEGVEIVFREHPQIVLTDLVMPGLSGLDVLERVVEFDSAIDVILMTAHYTSETAVEAIRKGASDYLNKPVSIASLRERIGKLIEEAQLRRRVTEVDRETVEQETANFEGLIGLQPGDVGNVRPHPSRRTAFPDCFADGPDRKWQGLWSRGRCTRSVRWQAAASLC